MKNMWVLYILAFFGCVFLAGIAAFLLLFGWFILTENRQPINKPKHATLRALKRQWRKTTYAQR